MKRVQRVEDSLAQSGARSPSVLPAENIAKPIMFTQKGTHAANHMKRVQRANGSLAQVWGRAAPNGLPAENITKPMRSRKNALCRAADSVLRVPPFSASPSFSVGIAIKKTRKPEVNQESRITAPTIRERANGDHDPRRNRNETSRKPSCLALCGKQQA